VGRDCVGAVDYCEEVRVAEEGWIMNWKKILLLNVIALAYWLWPVDLVPFNPIDDIIVNLVLEYFAFKK